MFKIKIMNIEDAHVTLTPELMKLIKKRKKVQAEKKLFIHKQNYEKAAMARDKEVKVTTLIFNFLQKQNSFDFSQSKCIGKDLMLIIDNLEEDDVDFSKAVAKLKVTDLERMKLVKHILEYNKGEITVDQLHNSIDKAFQAVRGDIKEQIKKI